MIMTFLSHRFWRFEASICGNESLAVLPTEIMFSSDADQLLLIIFDVQAEPAPV
jgi:hypothetical protein